MEDFLSLVSITFAVAVLVVQLFIIKYLLDLEKTGCKCAMGWKRTYILGFTIAIILYGILAPFLEGGLLVLVKLAFAIASIVFMWAVITYINALKKEKCECSASMSREVLFYWAILWALLILFQILVAVMTIYILSKVLPVITSAARTTPMKGSPIRGAK
jgi:hypothetical protein